MYLIHRRDELRGARTLQTQLFSLDNVEVLWIRLWRRLTAKTRWSLSRLRMSKTEESKELPVDGVFIAVGINPQSSAFDGLVEMDHGYIQAGRGL